MRVLDLNPGGYQGSYPRHLTAIGTTLFFTAFEVGTGAELWKSDGTGAGSVRVADINPGSRTADPRYITAVGNTLFFSANESNDSIFSQRELWKSDGTAAGTVRVADIRERIFGSNFGSYPQFLTAVGNTLFFSASGSGGKELWKSDGTAAGTVLVADVSGPFFDSDPKYITAVGNTLFFEAIGSGPSGLWALDLNNTDRTAPRLNAVTVEGNQLLLGFSEAILSPGLTVDRFAVTVGGANRAVTAISAGATSSQLRLTLAGAAPTSSQNVRVRYTDLSIRNDASGVIQDAAGNDMASIPAPGQAADTFRSAASVTALAATTTNLVLTGSAAINGTGNALANTITGNSAANLLNGVAGADQLIGGAGNDTLTGGLGADIFRFNAALSSTTNRYTITDFNPAQGDRIQLENAIFSALTRTGTLAATAFRSGSRFTSSAQRILYNTATATSATTAMAAPRGASALDRHLDHETCDDQQHVCRDLMGMPPTHTLARVTRSGWF